MIKQQEVTLQEDPGKSAGDKAADIVNEIGRRGKAVVDAGLGKSHTAGDVVNEIGRRGKAVIDAGLGKS
jgi:hypothetical protein